jgi:glycosyltransferase involved in cell wall biosynthesis
VDERPVRILYILTTLGIGGAEKQVIALAERMAARGHSVVLVALKHADEEWPVKLPVLRLNIAKTPIGIFRGLRFATNFLSLFHPDILHSHTFPANVFARLLCMMSGRSGTVPAVLNTIHNVHEGGWHRMLVYRVTSPFADRVTAVSTAAAERFVRLHAVPARKMSVLTNGIDTETFAPDRSGRKRMRVQMQTRDAFVWLAIGRLVPAKDYPNMLRAFAIVRRTHPNALLWIAGEGDISSLRADDSGAWEDALGDDSAVHLLGLRRDIVELLDAADGYVLSSAWEGMPLALGEAMAMEKPVVATDVGGVRELVGEAGSVVPAKDSDALANAMLAVMAVGEKERRAVGRDARQRMRLRFSMNEKADEWDALYAQLMKVERA